MASTARVRILLENEVAVRALQFQLAATPSVLALLDKSPAHTTARSSGLIADANLVAGAAVGVLLSTGTAAVSPGTGAVMDVDFTVQDSIGVPIALHLSDVLVAAQSGGQLAVQTQDCTFTPSAGVCVGDCNQSETVAIDEVQRCVNLFLDTQDVSACPECDRDGSGNVTIDEVQAAINAFLDATTCPVLTTGQ